MPRGRLRMPLQCERSQSGQRHRTREALLKLSSMQPICDDLVYACLASLPLSRAIKGGGGILAVYIWLEYGVECRRADLAGYAAWLRVRTR